MSLEITKIPFPGGPRPGLKNGRAKRAAREAALALAEGRLAMALEMTNKRIAELTLDLGREAAELIQSMRKECNDLEHMVADLRCQPGPKGEPRDGSVLAPSSRGRGRGYRHMAARR